MKRSPSDCTEPGAQLPPVLRQEIDAYCRRHGLLRDEALLYLLKAGLAAEAAAMHELRRRDGWPRLAAANL